MQEIEVMTGMNYGKITQAYQNAENQALQETEDPHLIVLTMLNALLKSMGIFVENIDEIPLGSRAIYSAHGVSPAVRKNAERRKLKVLDATCPLVTKVHGEA